LVISEKLRAQATGLEQAVKNAGDAVSVIQVAEGALQEVHSVLNSIRALAVHAANDGANDTASIAADQSQVDNAIDAISRIANTTKFLGKYLLNGGAANTTTISGSNVGSVSLDTVSTSGNLSYEITTAATRASFTTNADEWSLNGTMGGNETLTIGTSGIALSTNDNRTTVISKINAVSGDTGVHASASAGDDFLLYANSQGSEYTITVTWGTHYGQGTTGTAYTVGTDVVGTVGGSGATGNGLTLTGTGSEWNGSSITFTTNAASGGENTSDLDVTTGMKFNIGANAVSNEIVSFGIKDMRSASLGSLSTGYLDNSTNGIKTGQGNSLSNNAAGAVAIIDEAINNVSDERSKLGAYQKNAIESMQNNLGATLENIQAAESRIRDLDMAKEMMNFTKNQILIQAGTAMLAQANMIPQSALQLIG
jgi:flagellin